VGSALRFRIECLGR